MSCSVVSHGFPLCEKMRAFGVSHFVLIPLPWQTGALRHNDYTSEHNHAFLSTMLSLVLQIQPWQLGDSQTCGWHDWQTRLLYQKAGRARPRGPFAHCARRNWWRAHQQAHNELFEAQNKCSIVWATFCYLLCWEKVASTHELWSFCHLWSIPPTWRPTPSFWASKNDQCIWKGNLFYHTIHSQHLCKYLTVYLSYTLIVKWSSVKREMYGGMVL